MPASSDDTDLRAAMARLSVQERAVVHVTYWHDHSAEQMQDVHPPMSAEHLLDQFDANGSTWEVYDLGPINGSIVTAITQVGGETVLLSARAPSFDPTGLPQRQIIEIARTAQPL